ncbi:MAG: restriction endonuclease [Anaerolineae bacterium]|nr:restriction endonuclease [Anaerolineae bacterium]
MSKIDDAQDILRALQLPKMQQNELSALVLLVLGQLDETTPWGEAKRQALRIHDILQEIRARFGRVYAENTREAIRRSIIHQFEQARIVDRNPDQPGLATNSPRTHYALTDSAIRVIRQYGTASWQTAVSEFSSSARSLTEIYEHTQQRHQVPLTYRERTFHLSPGKHNQLQVAIVEQFAPRFVPQAALLYLGDTADKSFIVDDGALKKLGIPLTKHNKLPDIVLHDERNGRLFLIEAVTSHGPVTPKRRAELEDMLSGCPIACIFVSAFPDFATFRSFLREIAWETEVWLSEAPDHMIHFNGDRFLTDRS